MEYVNCNLCGYDDTKKLFVNYDRLHNTTAVYNIVQCKKCGLVYINPRPNINEIKNYYPKNYYSYSPSKSYKRMFDKHIMKFFGGYPTFNKDGGLILDVGCGWGRFLKIMLEKGWEVYGCEIDKNAIEEAKKLGLESLYYSSFEDLNLNVKFDVIRFWHVLEHLHDPSKALKKSYELLNNNGEVIIGIPNVESFLFKMFKQNWYPLDTPRHLYHFSPKTLKMLLEKNGFEVRYIRYNSVLGGLLKPSIQNVLIERMEFNIERGIIFLTPIEIILNLILDVTKKGDLIEVHAIKR